LLRGLGLLRRGLLRSLGGSVGCGLFRFDRRFEFFASHFALGDFGLVEQEIDHLVLIERRAQLGLRHRLVVHIFEEALPVFGAILLRRLLNQHVHFLARNLDIVGLADFRQQQSQPHPAFGDAAIIVLFGLGFLARLVRIIFLGDFG